MFGGGLRLGRNFERLVFMRRLLMLLSVPAMIMSAVPAYADPPSDTDTKFLLELKGAGLTYKDPSATVTVAKSVCDLLDKSTPESDIEKNLQSENASLAGSGARKFMLVAASGYCPKYLPSDDSSPKPPGS
jgi:Protein of unknown function (DUF732)